MRAKSFFTLAALGLMVMAAGCSPTKNERDQNTLSRFGKTAADWDAKESGYGTAEQIGQGSALDIGKGGDGGGLMGGGRGYTEADARADKLFAGALDVVLDLPVIAASREGGFIATDWKSDPKNPDNRFRMNIRVSGQKPYGVVRVAVLKQSRMDGEWRDQPADPKMAGHIEKAIRKRADVIKKK